MMMMMMMTTMGIFVWPEQGRARDRQAAPRASGRTIPHSLNINRSIVIIIIMVIMIIIMIILRKLCLAEQLGMRRCQEATGGFTPHGSQIWHFIIICVKKEMIAMIILIMQTAEISTIDDHDYSGGNSDHDDEGDHSSMGRHVSRCIRGRGGGHHRYTWRTICSESPDCFAWRLPNVHICPALQVYHHHPDQIRSLWRIVSDQFLLGSNPTTTNRAPNIITTVPWSFS